MLRGQPKPLGAVRLKRRNNPPEIDAQSLDEPARKVRARLLGRPRRQRAIGAHRRRHQRQSYHMPGILHKSDGFNIRPNHSIVK